VVLLWQAFQHFTRSISASNARAIAGRDKALITSVPIESQVLHTLVRSLMASPGQADQSTAIFAALKQLIKGM